MKPRLTLDTNVINARGKLDAMNVLERWHDEGKVELLSSTRLKMEAARHPWTAEARAKAERLPDIAEPAVWDQSFFGRAYLTSRYTPMPEFSEIASVVFPGQPQGCLNESDANDVMHLLSHIGAKADVFVTNGKRDFISAGKREVLKDRFGVVVMTPEEVVQHLSAANGWDP